MKTSERARIPRTVPAILVVLILIAAAAAGNAAAQTGQAAPMDPATSLILPETTGHTVSQPDGRSFDSPGQARAPTDESALPGGPYTNTAPAHEEPQGICGRNQAVQDSVLAELPSISQCSGVTGEHLRGLSGTLDISGQDITALSAADLQGMSGITGMDASGNQLSSVPGDLLQQLRHQSHTHSTTETSRNGYVMAVIDKSGSMSGQKLSTAKSGARWLAANRPTDMPMAVVAFSDNAHTVQDFTTETGLLNNAINSLSSHGGTNIDGALAGAYRQADSRPDTSLPVAIIVFSDGGFTLSGSLHETMSTNSAGGVKVSAISTSGQNVKMQDLAARGGGVYNTQPSASQSGSYFPVETTSETTTTTTSHEPSITSIDLSGNSLSSSPSGTFAQLPTLTSINLRGNSLTSVPPGLPAGLTALDLSDNSIGSLPDGVFNGLAQLDTLKMAGNPGAPFRFVIDLTQTGPATMAATLSQDAPFPMAAQLTARHTTLSPDSVSIARASKDGGIFTMTPDRDNAAEVTVNVTSPRFTSGTHSGLQAAAGNELQPEFPQVVSLTPNSLDTAEGETVDIRVSADRADDEDITIGYAVRPDADPDTADAGAADYTDLGNSMVTIPAGMTGTSIRITINSDQDHSEPERETLLVSLLGPAPDRADDYWLGTDTEITLTIRQNTPDFSSGSYTRSVAENTPGGADIGTPITARDPDGGAHSYSLYGDGASAFTVTGSGQLRTSFPLNFEEKSEYTFGIKVSDGRDSNTAQVTVAVTDMQEPGSVTITPATATTHQELTATLEDEDAPRTSLVWQWARAESDAGPWIDIPGENSSNYTPAWQDGRKYLRATAEYNDIDPGQSAQATAGPVIQIGICDRTPAVHGAIVNKLPSVSDCSAVTPEHLPLVTGAMDLSNEGITTFKDHDFEGLSGVRALSLDNNPITTLQDRLLDGLLDGLTDLRKIYMGNTQISAVTTNTFALNTQLRELWLYSSRLTEIDDGAFSNLSNLRELNLYNNGAGSFTAAKFQGLRGLRGLMLSNNELHTVPPDLLSNTPELRTLGLQVNMLRDLPDGFFTGMRHLTEVNLLENIGNYVRTEPGVPIRFKFPVNLERNEDGNVQARFPKGAPFPITVDLAVANGSASPAALTIAAGSTTSGAATITSTVKTQETVVSVHPGTAFASGDAKGFALVPGTNLTIPAEQEPEPASNDATLSSLTLSDAPFTFAQDTTSYDVNVAHEVDETTVTPATNDDGATYAIKLDGVVDDDGVIPLTVGANAVSVAVTAEDGETSRTYTVTVTRAAPPPAVPPDSPGAPTGSLDGAGNASLEWNDVETATGYDVGLWWNGEWTTLPNDGAGLGVSISGPGATVTGLPTHWTVYYFRVRAVNEAGTSDWSPMSKIEL